MQEGEFFESIELDKVEKPQQAVDTLSLLIKIDKNNLQAYRYRATAYQMLGNYEFAIRDCEEIIKINPKDPCAHFEMGHIFQQQKKYEKALEYLNKAIEQNENYVEAYYHRCMIYLNMGELKLALYDREKIKKLMGGRKIPEYETNMYKLDRMLEIELKFQRGLQLKEKKEFQNAIICFTEVIQNSKHYKMAYYHRASCYHVSGGYESAIEDYQKFIELDPTRIDVYVDLSSNYHILRKFEESLKSLASALALDPNYGLLYYQRCIVYCNLGDFSSAISDLKKMEELSKNDAELRGIYKSDAGLLRGFIEAGIDAITKQKPYILFNSNLKNKNLFEVVNAEEIKNKNLNIPNEGASNFIKNEKNKGVVVNNFEKTSKPDFFSENSQRTFSYYSYDKKTGKDTVIDVYDYQQMVEDDQTTSSSVLNL